MTHSTQPQSREVCVSLRVKPYDIDVVGVVSNIVYVRWMEHLRLAMLEATAPAVELVITGRYAHPSVLDRADLVTEMRELKHYYRQGVLARTGIEQ